MDDKTDYSIPLSYQHIENAMRRSINQMEDITQSFAVTVDEFGFAESEFKIAFAKSRLTARVTGDSTGKKMTADMAEDIATVETSEERMRMESARAKHDACRQALMSVRSRLESLRSLMASYRESGN